MPQRSIFVHDIRADKEEVDLLRASVLKTRQMVEKSKRLLQESADLLSRIDGTKSPPAE
jgi:hypothetical protein